MPHGILFRMQQGPIESLPEANNSFVKRSRKARRPLVFDWWPEGTEVRTLEAMFVQELLVTGK